MHRCREAGWLRAAGDEPIDPDLVEERIEELAPRGLIFAKIDPEEHATMRDDQTVYMSRYGRIDPGFWEDRSVNVKQRLFDRLCELVKRENEAGAVTEDRS